jgi:hypothetical protein
VVNGKTAISDAIKYLYAKCDRLEQMGVSSSWVQEKEGRHYLFWQDGDRKKSRVLKGAEIRVAKKANSRYKARNAIMCAIRELEKERII